MRFGCCQHRGVEFLVALVCCPASRDHFALIAAAACLCVVAGVQRPSLTRRLPWAMALHAWRVACLADTVCFGLLCCC